MFLSYGNILFLLLLTFTSCEEKKEAETFPDLIIPVTFNNPYRNFLKNSFFRYHKQTGKSEISGLVLYDALITFIDSYRPFIKSVVLTSSPFDIHIITYCDTKFIFGKGEMREENDDRNYTSLLYPYPERNPGEKYRFKRGFPSYSFLNIVYGKNRKEIEQNLVRVNVFGRRLTFNGRNSASYYLEKSVKEITETAENNEKVNNWIKSLRSIYTYNNRFIAATGLKSLHSYGLAVDFRSHNERGEIYWLWSSFFHENWWEIPDERIVDIPLEIVEIFESNGFVWGGRWVKFDAMHFEYRPEVVRREFRTITPGTFNF